MTLLISLIISVLIGTIAFWLAGKFSDEPPNLVESAAGAFIIQLSALLLSLIFHDFELLDTTIVFFVTWIIVAKIARMGAVMGLFGTFIYGGLQLLITFLSGLL